jgi:hypothetical protein
MSQIFTTNTQAQYVTQEIQRIWDRLNKPIAPADLNLARVARAIGSELNAGQIRGLKGFMDGKEIARQILSINETYNQYAIFAAKPTVAGNVTPAVYVEMDDPQVEGLKVVQSGDGYGVYLDGLRGAGYALLYLKANSGAADYILTDCGAKLTAAGVWTDKPCSWRRKRYVVVPKPSWAADRVKKLQVAVWTPRKGKGKERHISPCAEQFHKLFGVGDSTGLAAIDLASVGLLAVQSCLKRIEALEAEVQELRGSHG